VRITYTNYGIPVVTRPVSNVEFEWDPIKAAENLNKHGVSFDFAVAAFRDPQGLEKIDDREDYGEERTRLIGQAHGTLLSVVYAERSQAFRIISARRATRHEQDEYYRENSP
jgi:uncharacterized protein